MALNMARPGSLEVQTDASVTWRYFAPVGHTIEMCEEPNYWQNVVKEAGQERIHGRASWNKIEILAIDGSWEADLRVLSVDGLKVNTRCIRYWSQDEVAKPEAKSGRKGRMPNLPDKYRTEYVDKNGWRAFDPVGNVIAEKLNTEADAIRAAYDHSKPKAA